jgi:hypothetical protein
MWAVCVLGDVVSFPSFERAAAVVAEFIDILSVCGIDLRSKSGAEAEALAMIDVLDMWKDASRRPADPRPVVRAAMGFVDLAGKVVGVKNHPDFQQLIPHLKMLCETTVLQNATSSITDASANKVIELYMACLVMTFASKVELDHPVNSKGDNPDVMFDFRGQRWALALKTLHSRKPMTMYENIKKASDQIQVSPAVHGLVVLNVKNLLDYDAFWPTPEARMQDHVAIGLLKSQIAGIANELNEVPSGDWVSVLGPGRKGGIPIVFIGQAAFSVVPEDGQPYFMAIKAVTAYLEPDGDPLGSMKLVNEIHHASQHFV